MTLVGGNVLRAFAEVCAKPLCTSPACMRCNARAAVRRTIFRQRGCLQIHVGGAWHVIFTAKSVCRVYRNKIARKKLRITVRKKLETEGRLKVAELR